MVWYVVVLVKTIPFCVSHLRCQSIFELLQSIQPKQAPGQARNPLPVIFSGVLPVDIDGMVGMGFSGGDLQLKHPQTNMAVEE